MDGEQHFGKRYFLIDDLRGYLVPLFTETSKYGKFWMVLFHEHIFGFNAYNF